MTAKSTISAQREIAQEALNRIGYGPELDLASFPAGQRKKIEKCLDQIRTLEAIGVQTRADQIAFFGEQRWNDSFERLSGVSTVPGAKERGENLQRLVWSQLPDGPFKRFQQAFCEPHDWIIPKCSAHLVEGETRISFGDAFNPTTASVLPCLASPSLVAENLLESLGIADFSDLQRFPSRRLARKGEIGVVTGLKRVWDGAAPITPGEFRVLNIGDARGEIDVRYGGLALPAESLGKLLVLRRAVDEMPPTGREKERARGDNTIEVQVFHSPGSVLRRIHYAFQGYDKEIGVLRGVVARADKLHDELGVWSDLRAHERIDLGRRIARFVAEGQQLFELSDDPFKRRVFEIIENAALRDRAERNNPPKAQLVLRRGAALLVRRLTEAGSKEPFLHADESALENKVVQADEILREYGRSIHEAGAKLERRHYLFNEKIRAIDVPVQARGLLFSLHLNPRYLEPIELQPYRAFRDALVDRHAELKEALFRADRAGAKDALIKMHVVSKFSAVAREIEWMKIDIARDPAMTFEGMRAAILKVLGEFNERDPKTGKVTTRLFSERRIPGLEEPFNAIRDGLKTVLADVEEAGIKKFRGELGAEEEAKRIAEIREHLDEFNRGGRVDLMAALKRLP